MDDLDEDMAACVSNLKDGNIILYPTDTVWGLGCDARNDEAVERINLLKNRPANKSFVILIDSFDLISNYAIPPSPEMMHFKKNSSRPVTFILAEAKNLSPQVVNGNGSVAVRIPDDEFCLNLLRTFGGPIVSTSANTSNMVTPVNFNAIEPIIIDGVDYVVRHRRSEQNEGHSSRIIRQKEDGNIEIIRD